MSQMGHIAAGSLSAVFNGRGTPPATCIRAQSTRNAKSGRKMNKNDGLSNGDSSGSGDSTVSLSGGVENMKVVQWKCVDGCGACCKLAKGPRFASPEEIFDNPSDVLLYRSLIGSDGWCKHFDKRRRTCSIYSDRPYFCRVEPDIFRALYGINERKFNNDACRFCKDTIRSVYGSCSEELDRFNSAIRGEAST